VKGVADSTSGHATEAGGGEPCGGGHKGPPKLTCPARWNRAALKGVWRGLPSGEGAPPLRVLTYVIISLSN